MRSTTRRSTGALVAGWLAACVTIVALTGPASPAEASSPPRVDARAWVLVDAADGEPLAARAPHRSAAIASTTKLMTAYVARRALRLDQRVVAPAYAADPVESLLGLREGERIRARDLLAGLVLASGNDAAVALAQASSGSISGFVEDMNRAARRLGLADTRYANPIGLDQAGNRSSPADLAALAIELRRDPFMRGLFDAPRVRLLSGATRREVVNRNDLVHSVPWVDGVKTGQTMGAGHVLVGSGSRMGVTLVSVVLGAASEDARDAATLRLLRYGFSLYRRVSAVDRSERLATAAVRFRDRGLPAIAARAIEVTAREDQEIDIRPLVPDEVEGPIESGERIGRAVVMLDREVVARVPLLAARSVPAPTQLERIDAAVPGPRLVVWMLAALALALAVGVMLATHSRRRRRSAG